MGDVADCFALLALFELGVFLSLGDLLRFLDGVYSLSHTYSRSYDFTYRNVF